jgi:hypothetical protein
MAKAKTASSGDANPPTPPEATPAVVAAKESAPVAAIAPREIGTLDIHAYSKGAACSI